MSWTKLQATQLDRIAKKADRSMKVSTRSLVLWILFLAVRSEGLEAAEPASEVTWQKLLDGRTFQGWQGDTEKTWRIEDRAIVAGSLDVTVPRNEFLATTTEYEDFELRLKYKLVGTEGFVNGGVQ